MNHVLLLQKMRFTRALFSSLSSEFFKNYKTSCEPVWCWFFPNITWLAVEHAELRSARLSMFSQLEKGAPPPFDPPCWPSANRSPFLNHHSSHHISSFHQPFLQHQTFPPSPPPFPPSPPPFPPSLHLPSLTSPSLPPPNLPSLPQPCLPPTFPPYPNLSSLPPNICLSSCCGAPFLAVRTCWAERSGAQHVPQLVFLYLLVLV